MTQEEKQLLLKDLCARQFYGTKVLGPWEKDGPCELSAIDLTSSRQIRVFEDWFKVEEIKSYLRSMSSMTEEEKADYHFYCETVWDSAEESYYYYDTFKSIDWLNEHHFDYRGLIEKGLALKAPQGMYKTE